MSTLSSLTGIPAHLFYLTVDGRYLSHGSETVVRLFSGQTVRMHGGLEVVLLRLVGLKLSGSV